jgi:hypothetical protein
LLNRFFADLAWTLLPGVTLREDFADQGGNIIGLVQGEVGSVYDVNFSFWKLLSLGDCFGGFEGPVITAPNQKRLRLGLLHPRPPDRTARLIGAIVIE